MAQFNMQVDRSLQAKMQALQKHLGLKSKAETIRCAVERACAEASPSRRAAAWWKEYLKRCRSIPRRRAAKVMSEADFYRDLF